MSARVEAAAKAAHGHDYRHATYAVKWEDATEAMRVDYRACETVALAAADAVMFDDAAVERVANIIGHLDWCERAYDQNAAACTCSATTRARAVIAALKGDDQ